MSVWGKIKHGFHHAAHKVAGGLKKAGQAIGTGAAIEAGDAKRAADAGIGFEENKGEDPSKDTEHNA